MACVNLPVGPRPQLTQARAHNHLRTCARTGLADSLIGGVSVFYFALLSGRAFMWDHFRSPGVI